MRIDTFRASKSRHALDEVRSVLGDDAVVLRTRQDGSEVRIQATTTWELEAFQRRLRPAPLAGPRFGRPFRLVALVGPTGSGKTTTLAKLALGEGAFGTHSVGVISLDTFRIGAVEQIQTYADLAEFPLEILSDVAEVPGALKRLRQCQTVLVDTPGRGPRESVDEMAWRRILRILRPEEVHLVLPAGLRPDVAAGLRQFYAPLAPSHVLLTKLDEVPWEEGVAELADQVGLPMRWVSDGQEVPGDLHDASTRLLRSLSHDRGPWLPARAEAS